MADTEMIAFLKSISLFNGLEESDIEKIAQVVQKGNVPAQTEFFKEGDIGDAFYVLTEGEVEVFKENGNKFICKITGSDEGNFFGEMALIEGVPRNATIIAKTDCMILQIEKKNFDMLLKVNSFIALRIMSALTKRLRADTVLKDAKIAAEEKKVSQVITFFSPKGSAGKTTVATTVAAGISRYLKKKVLLIDLDLQFGGVAFMLGLKAKKTIADLTADGALTDPEDLTNILLNHPYGFQVLSSPLKPEQSESVDSTHLRKILAIAKNFFDYIIVDTHSLLQDITINALDMSDQIMLMMNPDLGHIMAIHNCLKVMESLNYPKDKIHIILNRFECEHCKRKDEIDAVIKGIKYVIHDDWKATSDLVNDQKIVYESSESVAYKADINQLITGITGEQMPEEAGVSKVGVLGAIKNWFNS